MTDLTIKEYYARDGSPFNRKDAAAIGPVLHEMSLERGLTSRDVVDAARSEQSPLHQYFEWNNERAADLYRLRQGQDMLGSIRVRFIDTEGQERDTRAFQIVRKGAFEDERRTYRTFQLLHGDSAFAAQMLGSAFEDLVTWKRKYEPYTSIWEKFGDVFQQLVNQIDEWSDENKSTMPAVQTDEALVRLLAWREECAEVLATWTSCRESIGFVMDAIKEAETAFAKVDERQTRNCMKCGREFESLHSGHRLCGNCLNSKTVNKQAPNAAMSWES